MNIKQTEKRLVIEIPASVDIGRLIAIRGDRGNKYYSADPLSPGRKPEKMKEKHGLKS